MAKEMWRAIRQRSRHVGEVVLTTLSATEAARLLDERP
jgi:hypothetical protein